MRLCDDPVEVDCRHPEFLDLPLQVLHLLEDFLLRGGRVTCLLIACVTVVMNWSCSFRSSCSRYSNRLTVLLKLISLIRLLVSFISETRLYWSEADYSVRY
jgi:hypothetical protein